MTRVTPQVEKELERHLLRAIQAEERFKMLKLRAMETIHEYIRRAHEPPRTLIALYELYLYSEELNHLRKIIKFARRLELTKTYPQLGSIISETEELLRELEEIEDEEIELKIKRTL